MDFDSDESRMSPNSYRYALNIRNGNSERGAVGAITNAEGNQEVSVTLPSGANRVIGCYDDEPNDRVIYIVYNDNGDNRIFAYDYKNTVVKTIVSDSGNVLGLSDEYLITAINVVRGEGTSYLLFTDNFGEPKNINIEQGIRTYDTITSGGEYVYRRLLGNFDTVAPTSVKTGYVYSRNIRYTDEDGNSQDVTFYYRATAFTTQDPTASLTDANPQSDWEFCPSGYIYGTLVEQNFTAIVKPPAPPTASYTTNGNDYNYLYGSLYQVKVRYVRSDGRESSWSGQPSFIDPSYPSDSLLELASFSPSAKYSNQLTIRTGFPDPTIYKSIDIAIRRQVNDSSPDDWQLAASLNIMDNLADTLYTDQLELRFDYDGTSALMPLDTDLAAQIMSWIPTKAKAQAVTSRNRVLYANFTEGRAIDTTGDKGLAQNPPTVQFFERDNPYDTPTSLSAYTYNGTTIAASPLTEETFFNPPIRSASGVAIRFPATVGVGRKYTISIRAEVDTGGQDQPIEGFGDTITLRPTSTTTSTFVDEFASAFTNNDNFYAAYAGGEPFNKYAITASNVSSGGSNYLLIQPTTASTSGGYTLTPQIRVVPVTNVGTLTSQIPSVKRGTNQAYGIVYSDDYGRVSTVQTHPNFQATNRWWRDTSVSAASSAIAANDYSEVGQRYARITLANDAPSWATRYSIVKTLSNGILNSIYFPLASISGLPKMTTGEQNPLEGKYFFRGYLRSLISTEASALSTSADSIGGTEFLYLSLASLQNSTVGYTNLNNTPLAYDFTEGDRLRLCYYKSPSTEASYFQAEADAEILFYSSELNAIAIKVEDLPDSITTTTFAKANEDGATTTNVQGLMCEIYTPQKTRNEEFYYEVYSNTISADTANSRYFHVGDIQTQTSAQSAILEINNGDCFLKPRTYVWKATTTATGLTATSNTQTATYFVEEFNYYDKLTSRTWGAGRPNRVIRSTSQQDDITGFIGSVERPTTIRYTDPFDPAQGVNGLGTIRDLSFKDGNPALRSIQHLHTEGSKTIIFHENAVGWADSDRAVITTLDGNNMTIGANTPLSDVVYYGTRAGIGLNPESFAFNNYRKYFVDVDQGQVCRLSMDGITVISDVGMNKYFKEVMRNMITSPEKDFAYGSYDKRTDEYTLSLKWNTEISAETFSGATSSDSGATIVFTVGSEAENTFAGDLVRVRIPEFSIGAPASYYQGFNGTMEVSAVASTTITVIVPDSYTATSAALFSDGEYTNPLYIYPYVNRTLTFSEKLGKWTSFHSFNPENHCSAGLDFVSFRAGKLYTHDDYANPMSYYGTDYNAYIDVVTSPEPDTVKVWNTTSLKATTEDAEVTETDFLVAVASADTTGAQEAVDGGVEDSRGKISTCTTPVYKEGQVFFSFMRTGTGTDYTGFIEGDHVRGYWARVRFKINSGISKIYKIMSVNFNYTKSNYSR